MRSARYARGVVRCLDLLVDRLDLGELGVEQHSRALGVQLGELGLGGVTFGDGALEAIGGVFLERQFHRIAPNMECWLCSHRRR